MGRGDHTGARIGNQQRNAIRRLHRDGVVALGDDDVGGRKVVRPLVRHEYVVAMHLMQPNQMIRRYTNRVRDFGPSICCGHGRHPEAP